MIIYNITASIDKSIHSEWLVWIKEHIPKILATGKFTEAKLTKIVANEEQDASSYAIQLRAKSREDLDTYYKEDASRFRLEERTRFSDKMLTFSTELEIIDEYTVTFN